MSWFSDLWGGEDTDYERWLGREGREDTADAYREYYDLLNYVDAFEAGDVPLEDVPGGFIAEEETTFGQRLTGRMDIDPETGQGVWKSPGDMAAEAFGGIWDFLKLPLVVAGLAVGVVVVVALRPYTR